MEKVLKRTLEIINEMERSAVIGKYAIVGSVGMIYHAGPIYTDDLDIFYLYKAGVQEGLIDLSPLYRFFEKNNFTVEGQSVYIGGVKVQFVAAVKGSLDAEAVENALEVLYEGVRTRVSSLEYIIAMKLAAFRAKDKAHLTFVFENAKDKIDAEKLSTILERFKLSARLKDFEEKYLK